MSELLNISPIDGRYKSKVVALEDYFSEYALIKYRLYIEITWLKYIIHEKIVDDKIKSTEEKKINKIFDNFDIKEAEKVKEIEKTIKHDVKSIEYYLQDKFKDLKLERLIPFIHITLTSEDVNNTSYNLMIKDSLNNVYYKNIDSLINIIDDTYNANPDSMKNAINVLNIYCNGKVGRKVLWNIFRFIF